MQNNDLVSIIIPTYNRQNLIGKTLESVLAQTVKNWECIVVDDGSVDKTWEVLEEYEQRDERIKIFKRDRDPKGAAVCRNIGANKAKGNYLIFLDSDDLLEVFCIEKRLKWVLSIPDNSFWVFPMSIAKGEIIIKQNIPISDNYLVEFLSNRIHWGIMCVLWKKDFFLKLFFAENYPRLNDPELMIRAFLLNANFKVFNDLDSDSVYFPANNDILLFKERVFLSFKLFFPSISQLLVDNNKSGYLCHLESYLQFWIKDIFLKLKSARIKQTLILLWIAHKLKIISTKKAFSLSVSLLIYSPLVYITNKIHSSLSSNHN
jgi:glycosyltransferase involved in cell wall biosynthesis